MVINLLSIRMFWLVISKMYIEKKDIACLGISYNLLYFVLFEYLSFFFVDSNLMSV